MQHTYLLLVNIHTQSPWVFIPEKWTHVHTKYTRLYVWILYTNIYSNLIYSSQMLKITQSPFSRWMVKLWYIHIMEYYSEQERERELLIQVIIWMKLKRIMVSEKKANYQRLYTIWFHLGNILEIKYRNHASNKD